MGAGIGGLPEIEHTQTEYANRGPRRISPFFVPASIINMISGHVSIYFGLQGPNLGHGHGLHHRPALHRHGRPHDRIRRRRRDDRRRRRGDRFAAGYRRLCAARRCPAQRRSATACRPWDKDRDGFVLGEGAGALVLEEYEHAKARGATIYAEVAGFGMSGDAYHMTAPQRRRPARAMQAALTNAGDQRRRSSTTSTRTAPPRRWAT